MELRDKLKFKLFSLFFRQKHTDINKHMFTVQVWHIAWTPNLVTSKKVIYPNIS